MGKKKKRSGHYCWVCGRILPNERFSGKGHSQHICRDCQKMPEEKLREIKVLDRLYSLPFRLKKADKEWLSQLRSDENSRIQNAAETEWNMRYDPTRLFELDEWLNQGTDVPIGHDACAYFEELYQNAPPPENTELNTTDSEFSLPQYSDSEFPYEPPPEEQERTEIFTVMIEPDLPF